MKSTDSEDASTEVIIKNVIKELLDKIEEDLEGRSYRPLGQPRLNELNTFIQNELDQIKTNELKALDHLLESINDKYYGSKEELQEVQLVVEEQSVDLESTCCSSCKTETSLYWRRVAVKKIVCNNCFFDKTYLITFDDNYLNSKKSLEELLKLKTRNHRKNNLLNSNSINQANTNSQSNMTGYLNGLGASDGLSQLNSKPLTRTAAAANNTKNVLQKQISCSSSTSSASSIKTEREQETSSENLLENVRKLRKSTRINSNNSNGTQNGSQFQNERSNSNLVSTRSKEEPNCVNRRTKKFKQEVKAPTRIETFITKPVNSDYVFHRGFFMQIGDIVALYDASNPEDFFFAQIRAFFTDQYGQKSAVITWLVPTSSEYAEQIETIRDFDPRKFALGPAEEMPRSLDQMEFVCRLVDSNKPTRDKDTLKSEDGEEFIDAECQFKNDLLKQKFLLDDLVKSKFNFLTNSQF